MSYKQYAAQITEQIFEADNAFFLESGVDLDSAKAFTYPGIYGGIAFQVSHPRISSLEIILEASDLYTVRVVKREGAPSNVICLKTKRPVSLYENQATLTFKRVFAFDLIEILWAVFYQKE